MLPPRLSLMKYRGRKQVECTQIVSVSWDCLANNFHLLAGTRDNSPRGAGLCALSTESPKTGSTQKARH